MSAASKGFPDRSKKGRSGKRGGAGVIDWEPAWVSADNVTLWGVGSNWENVTFFDFSDNLITPGGVEFLSENNAQVTFRVDMSGVSIADTVYITGGIYCGYLWKLATFPDETGRQQFRLLF